MPYTPLAALADGNVLSASYLNSLTANADHLRGIADAPNMPFQAHTFSGTADKTWYFRKRLRYILYQFVVVSEEADNMEIRVNGVAYYDAGSLDEGTYTGYIDLNGAGLTDLAWYPVWVEGNPGSGGSIVLNYLVHSDSTSL